MKRFLTVAVAMLALTGMGQVAMRKLEDLTNTNLVCVTDYGPQIASLTAVVEGFSNHASLSNLTWTASGHSGTPARLAGFFEGGMAGYAGFGLGMYLDGDDNIAVSNGIISGAALGATAIQPAGTNGWETGSHASFLTSAPPQSVVSVNGLTGAVVVTAAQIGALTNELDLAALRTYHYGSPDIVESPAGWFVFDGAGTITWYYLAAGRENVVIPWEIGGVDVTTIGFSTFASYPVETVRLPKTITAIEQSAFEFCEALTNVYFTGDAPAEAIAVFADIIPPPTVYVTDPQATGWGDTWNDAPVVRPPLYGSNVTAQAFTLNGDTITEWPDAITNGQADVMLTAPTRVRSLSGGHGLIVSGLGRYGGLDDVGGAMIGITYNARGNKQLYFGGVQTNAAGDLEALNGFRFSGNQMMGFSWESGINITTVLGQEDAQSYLLGTKVGLRTRTPNASYDVTISGSALTTSTNTAAVVRSMGEYIIGPTISGKQAHIFTDGTNCFFVNVNSVTNALTTN